MPLYEYECECGQITSAIRKFELRAGDSVCCCGGVAHYVEIPTSVNVNTLDTTPSYVFSNGAKIKKPKREV